MDFMKWLTSLDELLYEVMSWLVFYPLTLWRTILRPLDMMDYADRQLALPHAEQYGDALSPPLFLALTLAIAHGIAMALGQSDALVANRHGLAGLVTNDTNALFVRLFVFAAFPLVMSIRLVRRRRLPVDRATLRLPFYSQCYPAALLALGLSLGTDLAAFPGSMARGAWAAIWIAASLHYVVAETRWFAARLGIGARRAAVAATLGLIEGFLLLLLAGFLLSR